VTEPRPRITSEELEEALLGSAPAYTRGEVSDEVGLPLDLAEELWQQLGFPHAGDDDVAFGRADVEALAGARDLVALGILTPRSQAALVRTWGRSFARLAEWQVDLLADVAATDDDPEARLAELVDEVLPRVERLQAYVWRRHLVSAANRLLAQPDAGSAATVSTVVFVDIVGYTGRSKNLSETELVDWVEHFEDETTRLVVLAGGRVIKTIGDEVLLVVDDPRAAADLALALTERGQADDDSYPQVRAGLAHGPVVSRLGDVFGPTVNIAARLTSLARPGTVLVDRGAHAVLTGPLAADDTATTELPTAPLGPLGRLVGRAGGELAELSPFSEAPGFRFRRMPRRPVKGYAKLEPFVLRRAMPTGADSGAEEAAAASD
jgi:adenylate cyclase